MGASGKADALVMSTKTPSYDVSKKVIDER